MTSTSMFAFTEYVSIVWPRCLFNSPISVSCNLHSERHLIQLLATKQRLCLDFEGNMFTTPLDDLLDSISSCEFPVSERLEGARLSMFQEALLNCRSASDHIRRSCESLEWVCHTSALDQQPSLESCTVIYRYHREKDTFRSYFEIQNIPLKFLETFTKLFESGGDNSYLFSILNETQIILGQQSYEAHTESHVIRSTVIKRKSDGDILTYSDTEKGARTCVMSWPFSFDQTETKEVNSVSYFSERKNEHVFSAKFLSTISVANEAGKRWTSFDPTTGAPLMAINLLTYIQRGLN